ncbi:MAG TPA: transglutaminase domain-containing protein [Armatimonadetes bacterium]|nr:transglutaminase domain-containing protein [Armatimonadota bacterium]
MTLRIVGWLMLPVLFAAVGCGRQGNAQEQEVEPQDFWLGAYLGEQKIGFSHFALQPIEHEGQPAVLLESSSFTRVAMMGVALEQDISLTMLSDLNYAPLKLTLTMRSGERTLSVVADFFPDRVECQVISQQNTTKKTVAIPEGVTLIADEHALLGEREMEPGDKIEFYWFNPLNLQVEQARLEALRREPLTLHGQTYEALVVRHTMPMATSLLWLDERGEVLKVQSLMQLTFLREPKEVAMQLPEEVAQRVDIARLTAVHPDKPIPNPRQCRRLKLRVRGLENLDQVPSDEWQTLTPGEEGEPALLTITAREYGPEEATDLPLKGPELEQWLKPGPYVEADHPDIKAQVQEIIGEETNAYRVATAIQRWVHDRVQWQMNIGIFRSAVDILHDPAGVCRDAAVLYTALARAAGLPTRICAGLVYTQGAFFGHAWAESYLGRGWVPFDPTLSSEFVDATHLKLAQGEYTCLLTVLKALGTLEVEIVEMQERK